MRVRHGAGAGDHFRQRELPFAQFNAFYLYATFSAFPETCGMSIPDLGSGQPEDLVSWAEHG